MAISFPSSPTLNQTYTVGYKTWIWNGYAWDLQVANTVSVTALAQAGFDKANTVSSNTIILQGVDTTQNTNISAANNLAQGAFNKANSSNVLAQAAFDKANTAAANTVYAQGINTTQNTNITAINTYATSGYAQANSALTIANAAYANTISLAGVSSGTGVYSYYFDGSTQGIRLPTTSNLDFGSGNFTIEFWMKAAASQQTYAMIADALDGNQYTGIGVGVNDGYPTGYLRFRAQSGFAVLKSTTLVIDDTWRHIACVKSGSNGYLFVNGVLEASTTAWSGVTLASLNDGQIGRSRYSTGESNDNTYTGYLSNFRILKGTALYTSNFTVPAYTLEAIANTQLLTVNSSTVVDNSINGFTLVAKNVFPTSNTSVVPSITSNNSGGVIGTAWDTYARNKANTVGTLAQAAFDKANTGVSTSTDQYARDTANTAAANTVYAQGINTTQNTNIAAVNTYSYSAYSQANATNTYATSGYAQANAANNLAQSAYNNSNTKFSSSGGTVSGNVVITSDLSVSGNLYVLGNTVSINTSSFTVQDSMIVLGLGNYTTDILDIGFAAHYNAGTNAHTGIIRDSTTKEYYVFQGYTPELDATNNINIAAPSFATANINASYFKGNLIATTAVIGGYDITNYSSAAYAQANAANNMAVGAYNLSNTNAGLITIIQGVDVGQNTRMTIIEGVDTTQNTNISAANNLAQGAFNQANSVNTYAYSAYAQANATNNLAQSAYNKANTGGGGITYTASNTSPTLPKVGDQWYKVNSDILYEYISFGAANVWVDIQTQTLSAAPATLNVTTISTETISPFLLAGM